MQPAVVQILFPVSAVSVYGLPLHGRLVRPASAELSAACAVVNTDDDVNVAQVHRQTVRAD